MDKTALAGKLVILRKQKGLSQEQLANKSGVALRTIQRIETAKVNAHPQTLLLIATALETDIEDLTFQDEPANLKTKRNWLVLLHFSPLIGSFFPTGSLLVPFGFWLYKRNEDPEFDQHGRAVMNFQISMLILFSIALLMVFVFTPIGIFLIFATIIFNLVMVILNSWRISNNKTFVYPLSLKIFKQPLAAVSFLLLPIFLFHFSDSKAQQIKKIDRSVIAAADLDKQIDLLMGKAKVKGLEIAVFNKNKLIYKKGFGTADTTGKPLLTNTSIYGASLSKTIFAALVLKLAEEGILDLDKPLQDYLEKPIYDYPQKTKWQDNYNDLRGDMRYKKITARMCLDHTSGFPNWRWDNPDQKLSINLEPGSRYSYSGEGMVYLQTVIERMTGKTLQQLAQEKIFGPLNMKHSAYTWLPAFEGDYAIGFNTEGKPYEKDKDNEARAPSTLETSMDDYALFVEGILQDKILKKKTRREMFAPQIRLRSIYQFGPLSRKDTNTNDAISLSYGLGWGLLKSPYGWAAFKEGHGDGFQHYCIVFPESGCGIIIMTNSDNGESIFKELLETAIADKYTPWKWQNYIPYNYIKP